jgi:hypothetical protein
MRCLDFRISDALLSHPNSDYDKGDVDMRIFPCGIRVELKCTPRVNIRQQEEMKERLRSYESTDDRRLRARLRELDTEWDTERAFEAGASGLVVVGSALGALHSRKWFLITIAAGALLLERTLRGWSPMQPLLQRMGVRTASQIEAEKDAIRGILVQRKEQSQGTPAEPKQD